MPDTPVHPLDAARARASERLRADAASGQDVGHATQARIYDGYVRDELQKAWDELEAAAVEARVVGSVILSPERFAEALAEIHDHDDYKRVWAEFWGPVLAEARAETSTHAYDPAVADAIHALRDVADEDLRGAVTDALSSLEDSLDFDAIQRELHDFGVLLNSVPVVYKHATCGAISKPHTTAGAVMEVIDEVRPRRGRTEEQD